MPGAVAAWRQVARALGSDLEIGHRYADVAYLRIPVVIDGASVSVALTGVDDGDPLLDGRHVRTRVDAAAPGSGGLTARVEASTSLARVFGRRTQRVGDRAFDDRYEVHTKDPGFARAWLGDRARAHLVACNTAGGADPYQLAIAGGALALSRAGAERDPDRLTRAIRAVAAVAVRGRDMLDDWTHLAAHLRGRAIAPGGVWTADGAARIEVDADITIDSALISVRGRRARRLFTRVSCCAAAPGASGAGPGQPGVPDWAILRASLPAAVRPQLSRAHAVTGLAGGLADVLAGYDVRAPRASAVPALGASTRAALDAARPDAVVVTGARVDVLYAGHVIEPERLEPALALARGLAAATAPAAGPYR